MASSRSAEDSGPYHARREFKCEERDAALGGTVLSSLRDSIGFSVRDPALKGWAILIKWIVTGYSGAEAECWRHVTAREASRFRERIC